MLKSNFNIVNKSHVNVIQFYIIRNWWWLYLQDLPFSCVNVTEMFPVNLKENRSKMSYCYWTLTLNSTDCFRLLIKKMYVSFNSQRSLKRWRKNTSAKVCWCGKNKDNRRKNSDIQKPMNGKIVLLSVLIN